MSGATETLLNMVGAVALLLWGLRMVTTGITRAFGASLREWVGHGTRNRFTAFLAGMTATLALQSSTATCLMTASFAGRGLMTGAMALAVMLGADIGTSLVAAALSLNLGWLSPLLILVGLVMFRAADGNRNKAIGRALIGLGLMLLSLRLLGVATQPLRASPLIASIFAALDSAPFLAMLLAAGLTALAHSSLAVVLLAAALATADTVGLPVGIALVLGANLGAALPPILATAALGPQARRVPLGNGLVRLVGCLVALATIDPLIDLLPHLNAALGLPADHHPPLVGLHVAFNTVLALAALPVVGQIARLTERIIPEPAQLDDPQRPRHLEESALESPSVALGCAVRETLRLGDIVETMLARSMEVLKADDARLAAEIERMDDTVDRLHEAIKFYLARLSQHQLDDAETRRVGEIMAFTINLEHIGDILDKNVMELAGKKIKHRLKFSDDGLADLCEMHQRTLDNLRLALSVFVSGDAKAARRLVTSKEDIRTLERAASERHIERLRAGRQQSIETSALHIDLLRDFKRINAHATSVAYPILDQIGELRGSRLKQAETVSEQAAASP